MYICKKLLANREVEQKKGLDPKVRQDEVPTGVTQFRHRVTHPTWNASVEEYQFYDRIVPWQTPEVSGRPFCMAAVSGAWDGGVIESFEASTSRAF